jgi:hypothetical protein
MTQQGTYCFSPSGDFLGSDNTRDPDRMMRLLNAALAKWEQLPKDRKRSAALPEPPKRGEHFYPKDGLVLRQYSRDLGPGKRSMGDYDNPWNSDMVWFRADEVKQLLPAQLRVGQCHDVPAYLARRLARLHSIDNVLGQGMAFHERNVTAASMKMEVTEVSDDRVQLRITGESRATQEPRSVELQWLGRATWGPSKNAFTAWEMVAVGTRRGSLRAPYIRNDTGSGPIGFAFVLASDSPIDRIAPTWFPGYGWGR